MPRDKPVIFFAMGSSGKPELIQKIIKGFKGKPYSVITPVKAHICAEPDKPDKCLNDMSEFVDNVRL